MPLKFKEITVPGYEQVLEIQDDKSGLHCFIALHNTSLGAGLGGIRLYPYPTPDAALTDVLRLSQGMTNKAALAETGTGGAKSVIIADGRKPKPRELLLSFAEAVESLQGRYICAEDIGITPQDLNIVREGTRYLVGMEHPKSSGDPSYYTAWGTFRGIQALAQKMWSTTSVAGRRIAIQGLGAVGYKLARHLFWSGARLLLSDIDAQRAQSIAKELGAECVPSDQILFTACDILAPCALGGILNSETIPQLRCQGIGGCANNQLLKQEDAESIHQRGILYAPDYVINAGGLINVCCELEPQGYHPQRGRDNVDRLYDQLLSIFHRADQSNCSTTQMATQMVEEKLATGAGKRQCEPIFHH